mgnify:CR=1 FL=1
MRIKKLQLFTHKLEAEKDFYVNSIGMELVSEQEDSFTLNIGWSELTFTKSEQTHLYHYCFLIPANQLNEALAWMEKRTSIIETEKGKKTQRFENWNADAFYFHDASGNLAEFIVRYDLKNESSLPFHASSLCAVNEIGMPTIDVEKSNSFLEDNFNTQFWKGDKVRFGTNGDQEGLFLLPNYTIKDRWFPTNEILRPEPFEVVFEQNKNEYGFVFNGEEIEI